VFVVVFEFARLGVDGPSVDTIHLGSTYGIIAFVLGRVVHAVLVLAPMVLGTVCGVWLASRLGREAAPAMGTAGWAFTGLTTLGLMALAASTARPGTTQPVADPGGGVLPGSIAELIEVPIGGHSQTMMIRGRSTDSPVLLYLAGGPGGTDLGAMRADVSLEQDFVVVTWDQRGTGKSYSALDPVETLTVEQMVADTIEVTNHLRERFRKDKVYLVGNSWGTILGVLAVQRHPELFHAYVGTGQMVSPRETDIMFYEDTLAWAEQTGDDALAATLRQNGPPPYDNLFYYEPALSHEHDWNPYPEQDTSKEMPANLFVPENSLMDRINGLQAFLDTFSILYPQLQSIDFRSDVLSLDVPVYVVIGSHEARGRAVLAREWFDMVEAPSKEMITFEHSGHRPSFEEPAEFASVMRRVLEETGPRE
jgi:proline iminopeptidase